jgi:hypothetical protein
MSAALALDGSPFDRRALLRAGLLGGAALAVTVADATGATNLIERLSAELERTPGHRPSAAAASSLPSAAIWGALVGQEVVLTVGARAQARARVLDVADIAHPSPHVALGGEAYSVLFDAPSLPDAPSAVVTVQHASLDAPTLVLMPVNGDGSWEAVVDRRTPVSTL